MRHCKRIRAVGIFVFIFLCSGSAAFGKEKMETVYYYVVQPGDNLWKIGEELYGDGSMWRNLYNSNRCIFEPDLIYPGMKLEISEHVFPKDADERFLTEKRKETKLDYEWLQEEYVHFDRETGERYEDYPAQTEAEALSAFQEGRVEVWLNTLVEPRRLTEKEKDDYRKKDSGDILYSYEAERGLPEDIWYLLIGNDGRSWLIIENQERGKSQEFYCFILHSDTGEIGLCEKIHGAGGRLYLAVEDGILIWVMTKEMGGEVTGVAGDYRGTIYVGGNFYYEKQENGTVKEFYQEYSTAGSGTIRAEGATWKYSY